MLTIASRFHKSFRESQSKAPSTAGHDENSIIELEFPETVRISDLVRPRKSLSNGGEVPG